MTAIPACPPIPTLEELFNSGNFIEVNVNNLESGETVVLSLANGMVIQCMEIIDVNNPNGTIRYRINGGNVFQQRINEFYNARFYRRRPLQSAGKLHRRRKQRKTKRTRRTRKNKRKTRKHNVRRF